ncbi:hypothetical protein EKO27_g4249 [Xylaria grammica]|uniref:DNA-directed RNA polymerase subunit n=1 Tax=Xylaria grammica TaxID=363999 RepID=A0A439D8W1_9PEZI|nr:hypothetical protein EKO27_g4249 [Xylaria grammica]
MADVATAMLPNPVSSKSSKSRDPTSGKKRHRESNHIEKSERKHKRSKSDAVPTPNPAIEAADGGDSTPKRKRKGHKSSKAKDSHVDEGQPQDQATIPSDAHEKDGDNGEKPSKRKRKEKKEKEREKKKPKKSRESQNQVLDDNNDSENHDDNDDYSTAHEGVVTVSQYLPLHPLGLNEPLHGYANQHLEPLLNRYVPSFGGVLLAYRNPRIGEAPGKGSLTEHSGMEDMAVLESVNEAAVSFGWLTVEIDIFRPSRGAWLEGLVNIQSGGHIGVVCWGKFNASIESERLPRDWQWIDQHSSQSNGEAEPESTSSPSPLAQGDTEVGHTEVHATGYWVDGQGSKITAETPICFRIKNYEVGSSGDYGYLSIEGTMLTEEEEQEKARKEREVQQRKLSRGIVPHRERRSMLELGMTKFSNDEGREAEGQRTES